ncbi:MAG: ATP synthase F0 subunit B [Candidatus Omnitrophota bacterium]|nr:MAG: ATP synthase F0 subunit B [Candidatus Omnitrophota bacterium]
MSIHSLHDLFGLMLITAEASADGSPPVHVQIVTVIICFLLVYWVLKRFAFGPLLAVIDERRDQIETDLKNAADIQEEAKKDRAEYEERLRKIEEEGRMKMQELITEGKRIAEAIQEKARAEAGVMIEKAQQNIQYETEKARVVLKEDMIKLTIQATEHLIRERLDDQKHRELISDFLTRIERN